MQTLCNVNSFKQAVIHFLKNNKPFLIPAFMLFIASCKKEDIKLTGNNDKQLSVASLSLISKAEGATQVSSVGVYAGVGECVSPAENADYVVSMTGDLAGCLYTYVDNYECSPGGTYREEGREHFVGTYNGKTGSFWTTYKFESLFEGCSASGAPLGGEIKGRCQHPIVAGSGNGVFNGVAGRLDMKDDIAAGNFIIRGHLNF